MMREQLKLEPLDDTGLFACPSFTHPGVFYVLDVRERTCSCKAFEFRGTCKHLIALRRLEQFVEA